MENMKHGEEMPFYRKNMEKKEKRQIEKNKLLSY